jgi:hypothetical protein
MRERHLQSIFKALEEAKSIIDDLKDNRLDENQIDLKLWSLREQIEYSCAITSIMHDLMDYYPEIPTLSSRNTENILEFIKESIDHAIRNIRMNPKKAYGALVNTLYLHREFRKKRRKKRQSTRT